MNISKNIKIDYTYRFLASFNISTAIWVLYLSFKGMSLAQIGLIEGIFHITGLISEVPSGALADLLGRKKSIVIGRVLSLISSIMLLFSNSFMMFSIAFIISALSYNLNSGSEEALVYDTLKLLGKEDEYLKVNGRLSLIIEIAQGLAVFVGGYLANKSFPLSYSFAVLIGIFTLGVSLLFKEVVPLENKKERVSFKRHFKEVFELLRSNKKLVNFLLFFSSIYSFSATVYFYSQKHLSNMGYSTFEISIIFLINGGVSAIGAIISSKLYEKYKNKVILIIPILLSLFMAIVSITSGSMLFLSIWIASFLTAIMQPITSNIVNSVIESRYRATIISVESMFYSLSMIILFPISGFIGDNFSLEMTFIILGILSLILSIYEYFKLKDNLDL